MRGKREAVKKKAQHRQTKELPNPTSQEREMKEKRIEDSVLMASPSKKKKTNDQRKMKVRDARKDFFLSFSHFIRKKSGLTFKNIVDDKVLQS